MGELQAELQGREVQERLEEREQAWGLQEVQLRVEQSQEHLSEEFFL